MSRNQASLIAGFITAGLLLTGYLSFGIWTTFIFAFGFLGGYFVWLFSKDYATWNDIRLPYWLSFAAFILLHRVEEYFSKFQEALSKITGTPVPEISSPALIILVIASVGGWLIIPVLIKRKHPFGYYLAWTFFVSMGVTELAHFMFPLFTDKPYGYFPGMASVIVLVPLAWWGMIKLQSK